MKYWKKKKMKKNTLFVLVKIQIKFLVCIFLTFSCNNYSEEFKFLKTSLCLLEYLSNGNEMKLL